MNRCYKMLKIGVWCVISIFVGSSIYKYYDYTKYPDLYAVTSAPWYLSIEIAGLFTAVIVVILLILMWIIKKFIMDS